MTRAATRSATRVRAAEKEPPPRLYSSYAENQRDPYGIEDYAIEGRKLNATVSRLLLWLLLLLLLLLLVETPNRSTSTVSRAVVLS